MIPVSEARMLILQQVQELSPVINRLSDAAGFTLAKDIYATLNIPAYDQSSMDGYAFSFGSWERGKPLPIKGMMAAGTTEVLELTPGSAVRIFTGAPVPLGADTVVMQEKTRKENEVLFIDDEMLQSGANVRLKGSEIGKGDLAVAKNTVLSPAAIGFLAGIGVDEVPVYPAPKISLIVTGNELQQPGHELLAGQVYESNSFSLKAALKQMNIDTLSLLNATDELGTVKDVLTKALDESDVVLLTGGVSVGEYDFVEAAAASAGVEKVFHKIRQRPGKPLFFGHKAGKLVFGLPGNPASVLTCFYEYVEPALKKMMKQPSAVRVERAALSGSFKKAPGLTHFLKGYYDGNTVSSLHAQESYRLSSFANANCLIKIEENVTACEKGEMVEIHLLP